MVDLIQEVLLNSYLDYFSPVLFVFWQSTVVTLLSLSCLILKIFKEDIWIALCYVLTFWTLSLSQTISNTLWVNVDPVAVVVSLKILRKIHTGQRNNQLGMYWQNCQQSLISSNIFFRTKTELSVHFWSHNWRTTWATRRDLAASFV